MVAKVVVLLIGTAVTFKNRLSMTYQKSLCLFAVFAASTFASLGQDSESDEVFELSPFQVDSSSGYRASSTLSGTRLKTKLADVGGWQQW